MYYHHMIIIKLNDKPPNLIIRQISWRFSKVVYKTKYHNLITRTDSSEKKFYILFDELMTF